VALPPKNGLDSPERRFRRKRERACGATPDDPTPNDNLLYLLRELEKAIEKPTIVWSSDLAAGVKRRLEGLVQAVGKIVARVR
jgi:hypothetical protein